MTDKIQHEHGHGHKLEHDHDGHGMHEHWFDHSHPHGHSDDETGDHSKHEHLELNGPLFAHSEHHALGELESLDKDLLGGDAEKTAKESRKLFWGE
jgi:hypothetical protein